MAPKIEKQLESRYLKHKNRKYVTCLIARGQSNFQSFLKNEYFSYPRETRVRIFLGRKIIRLYTFGTNSASGKRLRKQRKKHGDYLSLSLSLSSPYYFSFSLFFYLSFSLSLSPCVALGCLISLLYGTTSTDNTRESEKDRKHATFNNLQWRILSILPSIRSSVTRLVEKFIDYETFCEI